MRRPPRGNAVPLDTYWSWCWTAEAMACWEAWLSCHRRSGDFLTWETLTTIYTAYPWRHVFPPERVLLPLPQKQLTSVTAAELWSCTHQPPGGLNSNE